MNTLKVYVVCLAVLGLLACATTQGPRRARPSTFVIHEDFRPWWLLDDVRWIITPSERAAYYRLDNDEARRNFIDQFWARHDPTPDTYENEFKNEHYRRLEYANEHFGEKLPGRLTPRGKIYIEFGKPDRIEASPDGRETWHYRFIENLGQNIDFQFEQREGEWKLVEDPSGGKNAFEITPVGVTGAPDPCTPYHPSAGEPCGDPVKHPPPRLKDLDEVISKHPEWTPIPVTIRWNSVKVTNATDLVSLTVSIPNSNVVWHEQSGKFEMRIRVMARFTSLTGRVESIFEDEIYDSVSSTEFPERSVATRECSKVVQLSPGRYRVDVAVKDMNADKLGVVSRGIIVTEFPTDEFLQAIEPAKH